MGFKATGSSCTPFVLNNTNTADSIPTTTTTISDKKNVISWSKIKNVAAKAENSQLPARTHTSMSRKSSQMRDESVSGGSSMSSMIVKMKRPKVVKKQ